MIFSILVANYNNGHFFQDCYESIINQTWKKWEVIIVDDCSTDDSLSVIKQIIGEDKRFKLYTNHRNRGCGFTKNRCAHLANGEILGFLDPDDTLSIDAVELMVETHTNNIKAAIVTSKYEEVDSKLRFLRKGTHGSKLPPYKSYLTYGKGALTHFASFKSTFYQRTSGIDPNMKRAVDQDLYYKLEEEGKHVFLDETLYKYRQHVNNISQNDNFRKAKYWHFYAVVNAYKRREKSTQKIDNFSKNYIKKFKSNYYLGRFDEKKYSGKMCSKYYFLLKSIFAYPRFQYKKKIRTLKLLILGKI